LKQKIRIFIALSSERVSRLLTAYQHSTVPFTLDVLENTGQKTN